MATHKFKVGDRVIVEGVFGNIYTQGYATQNTTNFHVCPEGTEVADPNMLGYQVMMNYSIRIIKESDIKPL